MANQLVDEALAQRIFAAVLGKINIEADGLSDTTCGWCGHAQWEIHVLARLYTLRGKRTVPCVSLVCDYCGNLLLFDLKKLGFEDLDELEGRVAG